MGILSKKSSFLILLLGAVLVVIYLFWGKHEVFVPVQDLESAKIGKIEKVASNLVYTCVVCGYKFSFPASWGFVEEGLVARLTTDKVEFSIKTLADGEEFEAVKEGEYVIPYSSLNISGKMKKSVAGNRRQSVVEFENESKKYVISSKYKKEDDLDRDLPAFLLNFQFLH